MSVSEEVEVLGVSRMRGVFLVTFACILSMGLGGFLLSSSGSFSAVATIFSAQVQNYKELDVSLTRKEDSSLPASAMLKRAHSAFEVGDFGLALNLYEESLSLGVADAKAVRDYFTTARILGDAERAESALGLLSFRGIDDDVLDFLRGMLALRFGDYDEAATLFQSRIQLPEYAYGHALLSIIQLDHDSAQRYLRVVDERTQDRHLKNQVAVLQAAYDEFSLFEEGQRDTHLPTLLARSLTQIHQPSLAVHMLQTVVTRDAEYRDAWIVLGYAYYLLQQYDDARASFSRAYALDPQKEQTQYLLGLTYERLGDREQAITFLEFALQNGDVQLEPIVRQRLALLYEQDGRFSDAVEQYEVLLGLERMSEQNMLQVYRSLVSLLIDQLDQPADAYAVALRAEQELGRVPAVLDLVGRSALSLGDMDQATRYLQTAVEQDPSLASAWLHLGIVHEIVQDASGALEAYKQAYQLYLGSDTLAAADAAERYNAIVRDL